MKQPLFLSFFIFLFYSASAQSIQLGYYTGESAFRNSLFTSATSIGQDRTAWSNNVTLRWVPKRKFSLEAGFGYYVPRVGTSDDNFQDYPSFKIYNEYLKDKIQDYEYYVAFYDRIFQSKNRCIKINVGGSATYFPEKDSRYYKIYNVANEAETYTGTDWKKANLLFWGINAEVAYQINKRFSINGRFAYKFEIFELAFKSTGDQHMLYDMVPNSYGSYQIGINYIFNTDNL